MTPTPVGMRCPECSRDRTRVHRMRSTPSAPVATQAIIAVNVVVYLAQLATGSGFGDVSGRVYENGVLFGPWVGQLHEYWRIVTAGFLHASFFHVAFNMVFIWFIGRSLEPAVGTARFVVAYFASLVCGSFGVLLIEPDSFAVGASGAAFGLLGTLLVEARARGIDLWATGLLQLALLNFAITFLIPNIAIGAHLLGFAGGLLVGLIYQEADRRRLPRSASLLAAAVLGIVAFVASIGIAGG
ncbi:MAG TPA: rhomboid family intramembrane serine protease [Conexibacter sp.]|nr:rhomboid family intramembrane serine protease [Conexibacter sp.]